MSHAFLQKVRSAVQAGNRPGSAAALEPRGEVGYQGAGADPSACLREQFTAAGGQAHLVADAASAVAKVVELVQSKSAKRVLLGQGTVVDDLGLPERLRAVGIEVVSVGTLNPENSRECFFGVDVGISGVDYLVAETGSLALLSRPSEPRSLSLLPPVHIVVADRSQLVPDLFDLFAALNPLVTTPGGTGLPSCISLITGPSKTGDIELRLVTGVHGPGELHLVLITGVSA